jgi:hypothetical protein
MRLRYVRVPEWPQLAWLGECPLGTDVVTCFAGTGVETHDEWFCEGVWAGPFSEGQLDRTDLVFGSGGRIRAEGLVFVAAGTTLDRLHWLRRGDVVWVSNSLPCLMAAVGGSLDIRVGQSMFRAINSIREGLEHYRREFPTTVGPVHLTYFNNLLWDGAELREVTKPAPARDFGSYGKYREFLDASMATLVANARDTGRTRPFGLMSTLSTGYDSSAVTVLAQQAGCDEAFGFDQSPIGQNDSGESVAEILGVRFHPIQIRDAPNADVSFLAVGTGNGGSVSFKSAETLLAGRMVFTGFHGDKVWDKQTKALGPDIVRGDTSGSDLAEYRLEVGFVNCPVPYWGVRQIRDIHALSNSSELAPWDTGVDYSRPICRRIVEERGVPREAFGRHKRGMLRARPTPQNFLTAELRRDYFAWVRSRRGEWIRLRKIPPIPSIDALMTTSLRSLEPALNGLRRQSWPEKLGPRPRRVVDALLARVRGEDRRRVHHYVVHWAVDRAKERYQKGGPAARLRG